MAISKPRIVARDIVFKIGSTSYAPEVNVVELTLGDAPGGVQTFGEVRVHGEWALKLDGFVSPVSGSLYRLLFDNFGTEATFTITPGGGTEGTDNPAFTGTVIFNELPPLTINSNEEIAFSVTLRVKNTGLDTSAKLYYGVTIDTTA
jgi:hypothetical protein